MNLAIHWKNVADHKNVPKATRTVSLKFIKASENIVFGWNFRNFDKSLFFAGKTTSFRGCYPYSNCTYSYGHGCRTCKRDFCNAEPEKFQLLGWQRWQVDEMKFVEKLHSNKICNFSTISVCQILHFQLFPVFSSQHVCFDFLSQKAHGAVEEILPNWINKLFSNIFWKWISTYKFHITNFLSASYDNRVKREGCKWNILDE